MEIEIKDNKPLVTFALFAYNQEQFIEEAIKGAFSQTYTPLEIILSDDCSPDGTFAIMEKMASEYEGPHNIVLNRNQKNMGLMQHVNKVFTLAKGEIIVVAAGDDISISNRVELICNVFKRHPGLVSVTTDHQNIDENNSIVMEQKSYPEGLYSLKQFFKTREYPKIGCARAYSKKVFDIFGPIKGLFGVEDRIFGFRSLLLGGTFHINEIGLKYRVNINSLSATSTNIINIDAVANQGLLDLNKASELDLISQREFQISKSIIKSVKNNFNLRSEFKLSKNKFLFYFQKVLFNNDFRFFEKKGLFKLCFKKYK